MDTNFLAKENDIQSVNIALWGPTQAGKDWLIKAFIKELKIFNTNDKNFHYEIAEEMPGNSPRQIIAQPPLNLPTSSPENIVYQFKRNAISQGNTYKLTESVSTHKIIIYNDSGENLANCLLDPTLMATTYHSVVGTENIIIILGPPSTTSLYQTDTQKNNHKSSHNSSIADRIANAARENEIRENPTNYPVTDEAFWNVDNYISFLDMLFSALKNKGHKIAICMTKLDLDNYRGEPEYILEKRYGIELANIIKLERETHKIKIFATSAAGYLRLPEGIVGNYINGAIREPGRWTPVGTAHPFFWLFEQIERDRLRSEKSLGSLKNQENQYIKYPEMLFY